MSLFKSMGVAALAACMGTCAQAQAPHAGVDPNAIRVQLSPELETTLASQMVGRISALNGSLGTFVAKGRVLVSFDCSEGDAKLQMAQAESAMAQETLETKQRLRKLEAAGDMEVSLAAAAADRALAAIASLPPFPGASSNCT
jgi:multidrug efflux pump subunit AcrA (membrane-fusion protein)